jgi:flavin reductase (DIM6/NTAB) family NADH-FMN oxidoreductase RutF
MAPAADRRLPGEKGTEGANEAETQKGAVMKKSFGAKILVYPTPVWVVGTYDNEGKPNMVTISFGGICSFTPPCVAVSLRKNTHSHGNIMKYKGFTVNVPSEVHAREADYIGIASGRNVDKFAATGLTPVRSNFVNAPYVAEFPLNVECRLIQTVEIGEHTLFIGEIEDFKVEDSVLSADRDESILGTEGIPDIEKVKPILYVPQMGTYCGIGGNLGRAHAIGKTIRGER